MTADAETQNIFFFTFCNHFENTQKLAINKKKNPKWILLVDCVSSGKG